MASPGIQQGIIRFGPFELDPVNRELRKRGYLIRFQPQQIAVLLLLTERAGQVVSREEIHQHIWGNDTFVDFERGINFSINQIRAALGDDAAKPRFIETIPRRGYRFIAAIESGNQIQANSASDAIAATPIPFLSSQRILLGLVLSTILIGGLLGYFLLSRRAKPHAARSAFPNMRITQLTSLPGNYHSPTFSPDGRQIAFFWDGENRLRGDLYVQLVGGQKPLAAYIHTSGFVCCADWSPDGQQIVFGRLNDSGGAMFTVPALGGTERKITDVTSPNGARWTADGKSLVLADSCTPDAPQGITVFSLQTGEKRCLHSPPPEEEGDAAPILSPDQKTVAFARMTTMGMWQMYTVAFSGGNLRKLTHETFTSLCRPLMWSPDGKYVVFEPQPGRMARVAASGGPVEFEAVYPKIGSLSRDGRRLAYLEPSGTWTNSTVLWRMDLSSAGGKVVSQTRILASLSTNDSAQLSPDEKHLVFHSARSDKGQIWKSNADGTDPLQLISFDTGFPGTPRWSPDGKWVAFDYHGTAHGQIYLIDSEGRNLRALTSGNYENLVPSWSRDGKVVYFASNRTGRWQVWKRELSTGNETQVTRHGGFAAFESYDARALYYSKYEGGGLWTIPVGGGQEVRITDDLHLGSWGNFAVTERGLYFVNSEAKGGAALLYYNFQTRSLSSVVTLKDPPVIFLPNLAASRDGRTLFYARSGFESNMILMVENFQ